MRLKPYTSIGIKRRPCERCGGPGGTQWQVCADGRVFRVLCWPCDVELNELVMRWVWGDTREADLECYRKERLG